MSLTDVSRVNYENVDEVRRVLSGLLLIVLNMKPPFVDRNTKQVTCDDLRLHRLNIVKVFVETADNKIVFVAIRKLEELMRKALPQTTCEEIITGAINQVCP
jgi:hypothetical protein